MNELTLFYAGLFITLILWYIKKYGLRITPGFILIGFYTLIAILGIPAYNMMKYDNFFHQYNFQNLTLIPYLFLFITTLLFLIPTFNYHKIIQSKPINYSIKRIRLFSYIYILCAFISIYFYYRTNMHIYVNEDLAEVRNNMYIGEQINAYNNTFERIFLSITSHFNIVAIIIFFLLLAKERENFSKLFFILLAIAIVIPPIGDAMRTISRGMIISLIINLSLGYSFFSTYYTKKIKKNMLLTISIILIAVLFYSMIVTEARFGEGDDSISSLICYWGQPPIIFNSQVAALNESLGGIRFFKPIAEYFGINTTQEIHELGKHFIPCFDTFIGDLYFDFSYLGVIILTITVPLFIKNFINKNSCLGIGHLYIMCFYCLFLQHGALVTKTGYCTEVLFAIAMYLLLKKLIPLQKRPTSPLNKVHK